MMELQDLSLAGETHLVVVVTLQEMDKQCVELMVVGELLEAYTVGNEMVLHKTVNVIKKGSIVEQLVMLVADSELECTKIDGWFDVKGYVKIFENMFPFKIKSNFEVNKSSQGSNGSTSENEMAATFEKDYAMSEGDVAEIPNTKHNQNVINQPVRMFERSSVFPNK
ncbi:hypothetical protein Tco_1236559 [Tanacetum coccineum]